MSDVILELCELSFELFDKVVLISQNTGCTY